MAWLSGWSKRIKLTIDSGKVDDALEYFPVLVYLSGSSGIGGTDVSAVFDEIGSNILKIAVTQSDGTTQCYVEIDKWDSANEKAWLWTKVPSISNSANTDLYLYYDNNHADNTTYVGETGSTPAQNVWASYFIGAWHMSQDPNGDPEDGIKDSTANENHGTPEGSMVTGDLVDAKVNKGIMFDDTNDLIDCGNAINVSNNLAVLVILSKNNTTAGGQINKWEYAVDDNRSWFIRPSVSGTLTKFICGISDNGTFDSGHRKYYISYNDVTDGNPHMIGFTFATGVYKLWFDGAEDSVSSKYYDDSITSIHTSDVSFKIMAANTNGAATVIDEVFACNTVPSAAWIKALYNTCWDSLITFGSEETAPTNIELSIPAFAVSATLLSTPSLNLSVPTMAGQGTLFMDKIFFGRFVQCDPLSSVASFTGKLAINLAPPVLASQSELKGNIECQLLIPVFAGTGVLSLSDLFIGNFISAPAFEATGSMNCDLDFQIKIPALAGHGVLLVTPSVQLVLNPFGAVASLHMASVNKFNIESAEIYYTFVLTGKDDGITDITIPISSFQARLRSGDPTYLSVVVPGMDHAGAISARPNGEMIIYMHYYLGGLLLQTEEIIRVDLEDINSSKGTKSRSIVLTGHRTTTTGGRTVTLRNPTYRNLYKGKFTYRCATPDIFLKPGDTVICGDDTFDVDYITYVVSVAQQSMEITGT